MTVLNINAIILAVFVLPSLKKHVGTSLIALPRRVLLPMSIVAGVSGASWVLALVLGFSKVLKTASWDTFVPLLSSGYVLGVIGAIITIFAIGAFDKRSKVAE